MCQKISLSHGCKFDLESTHRFTHLTIGSDSFGMRHSLYLLNFLLFVTKENLTDKIVAKKMEVDLLTPLYDTFNGGVGDNDSLLKKQDELNTFITAVGTTTVLEEIISVNQPLYDTQKENYDNLNTLSG